MFMAQLSWLQPPQCRQVQACLQPLQKTHTQLPEDSTVKTPMPQATTVRCVLGTGGVQSKSWTQQTFLGPCCSTVVVGHNGRGHEIDVSTIEAEDLDLQYTSTNVALVNKLLNHSDGSLCR